MRDIDFHITLVDLDQDVGSNEITVKKLALPFVFEHKVLVNLCENTCTKNLKWSGLCSCRIAFNGSSIVKRRVTAPS